MASYLAELGYSIEIHEKRHDMRLVEQSAGRLLTSLFKKRDKRTEGYWCF